MANRFARPRGGHAGHDRAAALQPNGTPHGLRPATAPWPVPPSVPCRVIEQRRPHLHHIRLYESVTDDQPLPSITAGNGNTPDTDTRNHRPPDGTSPDATPPPGNTGNDIVRAARHRHATESEPGNTRGSSTRDLACPLPRRLTTASWPGLLPPVIAACRIAAPGGNSLVPVAGAAAHGIATQRPERQPQPPRRHTRQQRPRPPLPEPEPPALPPGDRQRSAFQLLPGIAGPYRFTAGPDQRRPRLTGQPPKACSGPPESASLPYNSRPEVERTHRWMFTSAGSGSWA